MILKEITDKKDWNLFQIFPSAPFTQGFEYGLWQENMNRKVFRFVVLQDGEPICFLSFVQYRLIFSQYYWYCPYGPISGKNDKNLLSFIKLNIYKVAKGYGISFVRFDFFNIYDNEFFENNFKKVPERIAYGSYVQPRFEWVLDLSKSIEKIKSEMSSSAKLSINKAQKSGVEVSIDSGNSVECYSSLINLMEATSKRNNFSLHQKKYYEGVFKTLNDTNSFFCQAKFRGEIIVSVLVFFNGLEAFFLFGGSSSLGFDMSASYLVHFKVIEECKRRGLSIYNFGAISDALGNPKLLSGVTSFKKKFNGQVREHKYLSDIILNKFLYVLYNLRKNLKR